MGEGGAVDVITSGTELEQINLLWGQEQSARQPIEIVSFIYIYDYYIRPSQQKHPFYETFHSCRGG